MTLLESQGKSRDGDGEVGENACRERKVGEDARREGEIGQDACRDREVRQDTRRQISEDACRERDREARDGEARDGEARDRKARDRKAREARELPLSLLGHRRGGGEGGEDADGVEESDDAGKHCYLCWSGGEGCSVARWRGLERAGSTWLCRGPHGRPLILSGERYAILHGSGARFGPVLPNACPGSPCILVKAFVIAICMAREKKRHVLKFQGASCLLEDR